MQYSSNPDKITRDYFDSLLLETRYVNADLPSTRMQLFGRSFDTPLMTAALSHLSNTAKGGMTIYAAGAAMSKAVHWVGMGDDTELEEIIETGAATIKIIKPHADNKEVFRKIEHAVKAGCFAVGMDIDHAFNSEGGYDNVFGLAMKPKTLEEISSFVKAAGVPFVAKGVLSARDAELCLQAGCSGVVVSHHHGIMPYCVPPLMVLEDIKKVVGDKMELFVDCGIESGMDAYKCLALGAKAVSVGRHLMPFIKQGAEEVSNRIKGMTAELASVMARTGVKSLDEMDASVIHRRAF